MSDASGPDARLHPDHEQSLVVESGISRGVIYARGYRTVTVRAELHRLGFADSQCLVPALLVPLWGVTGQPAGYQARPDSPRVRNGKSVKYETPANMHMVLDIHSSVGHLLADPAVPLWITEGVKKGDALASRGVCAIALLGVWNWRGTNEHDGKMALPDWESVALNGRAVYIVFDSDVMQKQAVYAALARLKAFLEQRGARVNLVYLPPGASGAKVGVDDFLSAGHDLGELLALATGELRHAPQQDCEHDNRSPYEATPSGLIWRRPTQNGLVDVPLTNFTATIVADVAKDDGAEVSRVFEIEARLNGRAKRFPVLSAQFNTMNWGTEHLGASAIVYPGFGLKDHARAAIQLLSGEVPERDVYAHTGWRKIGDAWVYLHAGGAIGPNGAADGVAVGLTGPLADFRMPAPPEGAALVEAIRADLRWLDVAPTFITVPLLAAIYRAALGQADFSLHVVGPTGAGKSEVVALAQQHYGSAMNARHLPGSWLSTGNALEGIAFQAKDAVFVIDDFAPTGSAADVQRFNRDADRVIRAQGNHAGRQRMRSDATLKAAKPPRGLIVSTGEDTPRGQSVRARLLILELGPNDLMWQRLTHYQAEAGKGTYAAALAGFIRWLAPQYDQVRGDFQAKVAKLREDAVRSTTHKRTPDIIAHLATALSCFLEYATWAGALTPERADVLRTEWWAALGEAAAAQNQHQMAGEPARRFVQLLSAAIASGAAHVAASDGTVPDIPSAWGWRQAAVGAGEHERQGWRAGGQRVGWVDGDDLYLEPDAAYAAVQRLGHDGGETLSITLGSLKRRLRERGFLASTEPRRETVTVRRTLDGRRRDVLHLRASVLSAEPDQPDQDGAAKGDVGTGPWSDGRSGSASIDEKPDPSSRLQPASVGNEPQRQVAFSGRDGRVSDTRESPDLAAPHEEREQVEL